MRRNQLLIVLTIALLPSIAAAWSTKEHIQLTRIAVERLIANPETPPEMKQWLTNATPGVRDMESEKKWFMEERVGIVPRGADGLTFWAVMPDTTIFLEGKEEKKIEPFGVSERLLHYLDLELFLTSDAKREYRHDLSGKPKLADIPHDIKDPRYKQAGMLPFRVEQSYKSLVEQLKAGRLIDKNGQHPRDEHATKWAGYLAHYLEDNTQPQHATIDFKSSAYFTEKRKAPNVHAQVEYEMADGEFEDHLEIRAEFWPLLVDAIEKLQDPITNEDLFQATNEVSLASYDALPLIGIAAMKAAGQAGTPDHPEGAAGAKFDTDVFYRATGPFHGAETSVMAMKAHQQAWAVKRVEKLLRKAWDEALAK